MIQRLPDSHLVLNIPPDSQSLEGFRQWARSPAFPEHGKISLIGGELVIDMSPERIQSHAKLKTEVTSVLDRLVKSDDLGEIYADGVWLTNDAANLSNEPDAMFVSWERLQNGQVRIVLSEDEEDGVELSGTPDWVMEVVSRSSVRKDTVLLLEGYHRAEIPEYWLIDARGDEIQFIMHRWGKAGYETVEPEDGWLASPVFGRKFNLQRSRNRVGGWTYTLREKA